MNVPLLGSGVEDGVSSLFVFRSREVEEEFLFLFFCPSPSATCKSFLFLGGGGCCCWRASALERANLLSNASNVRFFWSEITDSELSTMVAIIKLNQFTTTTPTAKNIWTRLTKISSSQIFKVPKHYQQKRS